MAVDLSVFGKSKTIADFQREEELFNLAKLKAKQDALGQNPASIKLADEIQKARAMGDTQRLNDLQMSAKLLDRGVVYDAMGNPMAMGGYGNAVGSIEGAKAMYKQNAENVSDLNYKPIIERDVQTQKSNVELGYAPQIDAARKAATMKAEKQTQAGIDLPQREAQAQEMLNLLDSIETDKGMSAVVGMPNPLKGGFGAFNVRGSPAADFQTKLDQLGGKQFLEAFQSLKGGGQITEVEGTKATNAIARMQTAQSEEAFLGGLNEFKGIVSNALTRSQQAAQDPMQAWMNKMGQMDAAPQANIPQLGAQSPALNMPTKSLDKATAAESIFNAKKAIQKGADANVVRQRLIEAGIDPSKAGL